MRKPPSQAGIRPDFHVHSTFSDGLYTPQALCHMAVSSKLSHLSLCDHDTLAGLAPMAEALGEHNAAEKEAREIFFLPGVEVSTGIHGRIHILGYGADPSNPILRPWMDSALSRRRKRLSQMLDSLSALGIEVPAEDLPAGDTQAAGRAHIARALMKLGIVNTLDQAFGRFLGEGKPAYIPYEHTGAVEAVALLREAHCVPVLAHPARLALSGEMRLALVRSLVDAGLMGIEVFHPSASRRDIRTLESFARKQGLLITGGSDFHGDTHARLGEVPSGWTSVQEDTFALLSAVSGL